MRALNGAVPHNTPQCRQHEWCFLIGRKSVVAWPRVVRIPHHRRLRLGSTGAPIVLPKSIQHRRFTCGVRIGEDVHVLIETLVHPAVPCFVVAHHHGPPLMPRLMVSRALIGVDHHGILHTRTRSVLQR